MIKMSYLGLYILFLISDVVFSETSVCLTQNPCECILPNKTIIDLSSVGLPGKPRFYDISFNATCAEVYSYNPCFPFDSPDKYATTTGAGNKPCVGASVKLRCKDSELAQMELQQAYSQYILGSDSTLACVKGFGGPDGSPPEEHAIGLQSKATFGKTEDEIYINYTVPGSPKVLQVNLKCNESSDTHELAMEENSNCSYSANIIILTLSSKCACPNGCKRASPADDSSSSLSAGSKLLIAFFTILLAYLIIGIVWNYCNGSQGMELVPNIEFWNDLPTLIMEGVVFTCSCCGRQRSYGEV